MKKIGILCASDMELAPFLPHIRDCTVTEAAMLRVYEGYIGNLPVAALFSGVCKVNAAIAAGLLIDRFGVDAVLCVGVAGGMASDIRIFDTVIASQTAYHDVAADILTEFHPWIPSVWFDSDARLLAAAKRLMEGGCPRPIRLGRIVSGEAFIEGEMREDICRRMAPLAVDMETAAVAHVCYVNHVPFIAVRTISDCAEHDDFEENGDRAAEIAAEVTLALLDEAALM